MRRALPSLLCVAALAAAMPAFPAPQSLAERVAALEQKAQSPAAGEANIELLNRLTQLQADVQSLRNQVEQLQNENAELRQQAKDRYVDLDSRLARLEGGSPSPSPAAGAAPSASASAVAPTPAAPAANAATPMSPVPTAAAPANPADEQAAYASAFDALKASDYVASARGFKAYLQAYPQGSLAPNAWYWLGESYYVTQNYAVALDAFNALLDQFPGSAKAPDALLKRGYCQIELKQVDAGRRTLGDVIGRYPDSDAARLAETRLRALSLESR